MSTFEIIELIFLGIIGILMTIMIIQECNRRYWKKPEEIPDKLTACSSVSQSWLLREQNLQYLGILNKSKFI